LTDENLAFLDKMCAAMWPFHVSHSSLIDTFVTIVRLKHGAGEIELSPASLQENLRNVRNASNSPHRGEAAEAGAGPQKFAGRVRPSSKTRGAA